MDPSSKTIVSNNDLACCENCWLSHYLAKQNNCINSSLKCVWNNSAIEYKKGATIIKSGDAVSGLFCVQKGFVRVFKTGRSGEEFIVSIASPGDIIGLNSFINDNTYSFSANTVDKTSVCFIPTSDLKLWMQNEPTIVLQLTKKICKNLNFVETRIANFSGKSIREQCAEILISVAVENEVGREKLLCVNYSVKDIANFIGTTRNYLYKILNEFTSKNIVSLKNRKLFINDLKHLTLIANGNENLI